MPGSTRMATFAFLTYLEAEGAPIDWQASVSKSPELVGAAVAAGFCEHDANDSAIGALTQDWRSFLRGARALIGDNGSTLLEVIPAEDGSS